MSTSREDLYEQDILKNMVDIKGLSYKELHRLCVSFINDELLTADNIKRLKIDSETAMIARHYMCQASAFFVEGTITKELLREERISCWAAHGKYPKELMDHWMATGEKRKSTRQNLLRLIVCCLYADWDECGMNCEYDAEDVLHLFFNCLMELESGYCEQLRLYLQKSLCP